METTNTPSSKTYRIYYNFFLVPEPPAKFHENLWSSSGDLGNIQTYLRMYTRTCFYLICMDLYAISRVPVDQI